MFSSFDHLVEPCWPLLSLVQWSLIAIKLFTEQMLSNSTFPLFFEMLSVIQCVWPVTEHLFSSCVCSGWLIGSAKFSLVQQNVQHVWPLSNWTSPNDTQLCWTNVQCCSVKMFSTFDRGLTTEINFDLILSSPDDEWFQIIILFLVSAQCISSSLKNRITENYPDSQMISQQELRIHICCTLSINIVNACFDHHYSTAVLQTKV